MEAAVTMRQSGLLLAVIGMCGVAAGMAVGLAGIGATGGELRIIGFAIISPIALGMILAGAPLWGVGQARINRLKRRRGRRQALIAPNTPAAFTATYGAW